MAANELGFSSRMWVIDLNVAACGNYPLISSTAEKQEIWVIDLKQP